MRQVAAAKRNGSVSIILKRWMSLLAKWFRQVRDKKIPVIGEMLLLKTQEYAEVCGCENPKKLNMSWINQWKVRKDIVCKKLHGEAESVDQNGVDVWQTNCLPSLLK